MSRAKDTGRRNLRRGLNWAVQLFGARLLTERELRAFTAQRERVVRQLVELYENTLSDLPANSARLTLIQQLLGTEVSEAIHLIHHLQRSLSGPGDVCELGVAQGATSALIANEIRKTERVLWLYDSFEGLSTPTDPDVLIDDIFDLGAMSCYAHTMAFSPRHVEDRLRAVGFPQDRTKIIRGYIQRDVPADQLPSQVAFAYIDFDLYEPILTGLELLHPRCRPGSELMVDDYRYFSAGAETAVKEFMASHPNQYNLWEAPRHAGHFCVLRRLKN